MSFSLFGKQKKSSGLFIPDGTNFKELIEYPPKKSINDVAQYLGYNIDQVHTYYGDFNTENEITSAVIEIFTRNIVFILTKDSVVKLNKNKVDYFFRKFDLKKEFQSWVAEGIFEKGIENKTLRIEFLSRVLGIAHPEPDGVFNIPALGLNLCFSNGFLTEFLSADGLNQAARNWKEINPSFIESYEKEAGHYWGKNIAEVLNEINLQAEAYENIPDGLKNEFIPLHKNKFDNINFAMLRVCHYNKNISLSEFTKINHGRYKELLSPSESKKFQLDQFTYDFSISGDLIRVTNK